MSDKLFRFGANLSVTASHAELLDEARAAEDLGYDVILVPDHIGMPAPFPLLTALAAVTTRPRLGTFVLNTAFYNPALLARDAATTDLACGGRLELGLGAGWAQTEFAAAGLPFPSAGKRIEHLEHTITELRRMFAAGEPSVSQHPAPPIVVAGRGDRLLRTVAPHADVISLANIPVTERPFTPEAAERSLAERVEFLRTAAGARFDHLELGLTVAAVHLADQGEPDLSLPRMFAPDLSEEELLALPGVLHGSPDQIAETLYRYRERYRLTHFAIPATSITDFAKVISRIS
ncbi:TIGR03621 family F420-dependent LLM class oxidoreductase [Nocardia sp. NPDC005998]|uniref:TIGR03621 family F420-dependent LLM class oxidoreductase n=1 Tax=Nocardia sp. NPDC005998 TaxID=3156894 RepID=UPI0033A92104